MMGKNRQIRLPRELYPWESSIASGYGLYLVGGTVRDIMMGESGLSVDADYIATGIELEELVPILEEFGKTDLVGKSFGVIKFRSPEGRTVDISLPRSEESTGPGHRDFDVRYDPWIPVEEDLSRRDFTINSMALDLGSMDLIDPLGGLEDLEKGILKANRETSFLEDPLRILRGVQFMARFCLEVEERTAELMSRDAPLTESVSPERIRMELDKMLLLAEEPSIGFVFMHHRTILAHILPELEETWGVEQNEFHPDDVFHHSVKSCDLAPKVLHLRLAALLHDLGKIKMKAVREDGKTVFYRHEEESAAIAGEILGRLTYSNEIINRVVHLIEHHMFFITDEWSDSAVRRFIARVGVENIEDLFTLRMADGESRQAGYTLEEVRMSRERVEKVLEIDAAFKKEDLDIDGNDIMDITGLGPGEEIGEILDTLLDRVLEDPSLNTREKLKGVVREMKRGKG